MKDYFTIKNGLLALFGTFLIAISAQLPLQLPLINTDIPGTWQTFAVLVFAFVTNRWVAITSVLLYLLAGVIGMPVFADGSSGLSVLLGKTGGYLYGFAFGAGLVSWLGERYGRANFIKGLIAMTLGTATILVFGVSHLGASIGFENALKYGLYPFLLGAAIKIIFGAAVVPFYFFMKKRTGK